MCISVNENILIQNVFQTHTNKAQLLCIHGRNAPYLILSTAGKVFRGRERGEKMREGERARE